MAIIYNGTEIANNYKISFNGTNLKKVYARNTALGTLRQVWPSPETLGHIDIVKTGDTAEVKVIDTFLNNDFKVIQPSETKTFYYPNVYGVNTPTTLTTTAQTFTIKAKKTNMLDSWQWSFGTSIWSRLFCQMIVDLNDVPEGHHQYVVERTDSEFVVNATSESGSVVLNSYFKGYSQNGYSALDGDFAIPRQINIVSGHSSNVELLMFNGEFKMPSSYPGGSATNDNTFFPEIVSIYGHPNIPLDNYYDTYMSTHNYNISGTSFMVLGTINCLANDGYYGRYAADILPENYTAPHLIKVDSEQFNKFSTPIINAMEI